MFKTIIRKSKRKRAEKALQALPNSPVGKGSRICFQGAGEEIRGLWRAKKWKGGLAMYKVASDRRQAALHRGRPADWVNGQEAAPFLERRLGSASMASRVLRLLTPIARPDFGPSPRPSPFQTNASLSRSLRRIAKLLNDADKIRQMQDGINILDARIQACAPGEERKRLGKEKQAMQTELSELRKQKRREQPLYWKDFFVNEAKRLLPQSKFDMIFNAAIRECKLAAERSGRATDCEDVKERKLEPA